MRKARKAIIRLVALQVTAMATAACTASAPSTNASTPKASTSHAADGIVLRIEGGDPKIIVSEAESHHLASLTGTLRYDTETKCLTLSPIPSGRPHALVWPKETRPTLINGLRGVDVPSVGSIREGDQMTAVGGTEFWKDQPPAVYKIDNPNDAVECVQNIPGRQVFVVGVIENVRRSG
jgi:hypothetical protein